MFARKKEKPAMSHITVLLTVSTEKEADKIVRQLLNQHLIACANTLSPVKSQYWWKDRIEETSETLVIMKTQEKLFDRLAQAIKQLHSYEVPEILALPIIKGAEPYLKWLDSVLATR